MSGSHFPNRLTVCFAVCTSVIFLMILLIAAVTLLPAQMSGVGNGRIEPVKIILDSDMAHDADDAGDHAVLWALAARGEASVLALIVSSTNDYSAPCAHAIASYYGHPNVPLGANKGNIPTGYAATSSYYTEAVSRQFERSGETRAGYPDAVIVYRRALAAAQETSVYIVAGGYYFPLSQLLQSPPDSISPFNGMQLVEHKVRQLIVSGGRFPDSGSSPESNLANDPDSASYVVANWPTEIVWIGYDEGWNVITGPALNSNAAINPVKAAYDLHCRDGHYCADSTPAWTQIALLYAIEGGVKNRFSVGGQNGSTVVWSSATTVPGRSIWFPTPNRRHSYIHRTIAAEEMSSILNSLLQWVPPATASRTVALALQPNKTNALKGKPGE